MALLSAFQTDLLRQSTIFYKIIRHMTIINNLLTKILTAAIFLTINSALGIEIASISLPPSTQVTTVPSTLNWAFSVKGNDAEASTSKTYNYNVYAYGVDFYGNTVYFGLAQGDVQVRGEYAVGDATILATTANISGSWTIDDHTLHNTTNGYQIFVAIYRNSGNNSTNTPNPFPSTISTISSNTTLPLQQSGTITINLTPDISIPAISRVESTLKSRATSTATVAGGVITALTLASVGSGYDPVFPPRVILSGSGGAGSGATATAIVNQQTGRITNLMLHSGGSGYVAPVTVTIDAPPTYMTQRTGGVLYSAATPYYGGDMARFFTSVTVAGRPLRSTEKHRLQTVFSTDPALVGQSGSDDFEVSFVEVYGDMAGRVTEESRLRPVQVQDTPPALKTYGVPVASGSNATADAVITTGRVSGFNNLSGGNGYDSANPPSVTISSATGAGATAFATVNATTGEVSGITMVNPGAGYVTATVAIAPPLIGARYYTPLPDDGFLDIGEKVQMEYEVLLPKNYAGIYYVGAQANSAQEITESDSPSISSNSTTGNLTTGNATSNSTTGNSTLSPIVTNNVFMSNIAARIQLLSGPQESTGMLTATFSANGSLSSLSNGPSDMTAIDGAGRFVAFQSLASNLAGNAATSGTTTQQNYQQINRRDVTTGVTEVVSISSGGALGNSVSQNPSINRSPQNLTEDGKFVTFESQANNLVENDINAASDIFVRSYGSVLRTNRISVNEAGDQGNSGSFNPSISGDGRFVTFESEATNLDLVNPLSTTGATGNLSQTATASAIVTAGVLISINATEIGSGYDPANPPAVTIVSATGTGAAATATVTNGGVSGFTIVSGGSGYDTNNSTTQVFIASPQPNRPTGSQIYVHDRDVSGSGVYDGEGNTRTYLVSITNNGSTAATATANLTTTGGQIASITVATAGSKYVPQYPPSVVISAPPPTGTQATAEAYVAGNGTIQAVRITNPGSGYATAPTVTIAPRARCAGDALNRRGVYGWNNQPRISDDGSVVTWTSYSSNLQLTSNTTATIGDTGWRGVVYRIELNKGIPLPSTLEAVSVNGNGTNPTTDLSNALAFEPSINTDGKVIAFTSWANNLGNSADTNGVADVFVRDYNLPLVTNRTRRVSESLPRLAVGSITFDSTSKQTSPASRPPNNNPETGDFVTLNDGLGGILTFTFATTPTAPLDVEIGATASVSRDNLVRAINDQFLGNNTTIIAGNIPSDRIGTVNTNSGNNTTLETAEELMAFTAPGSNTPANPGLQTSATAVADQAKQPRLLLINTAPGADGNIDISGNFGNVTATRTGMQFGGSQADIDSGEIDGVQYGSAQPTLDSTGYTVAFRSTMETLDVFDRSFTGSNGLLQGEILRVLRNRSSNIFVADRNVEPSDPQWGSTERSTRASVSRFGYSTQFLLGTPSSANSHKPALSANGRFVAFSSDAENRGGLLFGRTNFDPLDTNGFRDIFLHDRLIATELPPVVKNNRPQVILTEPSWLSGGIIGVGSTIYLNAFATDLDQTLGLENVTFLVNGIPIPATRQYGNYFSAEYLVSQVLESNTISARVIDNSGTDSNTALSSTINFQSGGTINRPISIVLSEPDFGGRTPIVGQAITLNATVTMPFLSTSQSIIQGIVRFYANGILIGEQTVNNGASNSNISFQWIPQSAGESVYLSAVASTFAINGAITQNGIIVQTPNNYATLLSNILPPISVVGLPDEAPEGSPEDIAQVLFQRVMSRSPSATELAYYTAQLTSGALTTSSMVAALINLPEYTQFHNRLFDFYYRLGTAPASYNYLSNLSLIQGNTSPLPSVAYDTTILNPATPFGSTQGQAAAAQAIVSSPAFSDNFPGIPNYTNQNFWTWYSGRMKLFGGSTSVYGTGALIVTGVMNTSATAPQGSGVAFTTAYYAAKDSAKYGPSSPYQFQLKATALQWLFTGNWTAPSVPAVTTQAQLNTLITSLVDASIGQPTWSWVLANGLTGANATASATNGTAQQNLIRYAFNGNGSQSLITMNSTTQTSGMPWIRPLADSLPPPSPTPGVNSYLQVTYVKRKNSPTVTYIPEFAWTIGSPFVPATAENSVTTTTSINSIWERVTVTDKAVTDSGTPALSRFARVRLVCRYWTPQNP